MRLLKRKMCVKDTPSSDQYGHTDVKQHLMATFTAIGLCADENIKNTA